MANEEHLKILKQGAEAWNQWRKQNLDVSPGLSGADLSGADLSRANLSGADLSGADLRRAELSDADLIRANLTAANLSGADLSRANLSEADLSGADLSWAELNGANLSGADLSGADLNPADLIRANLRGANLFEANITDSIMGSTTLADLDLSTVKGLEAVTHAFPSTIGIDTIYRSKGQIPEAFLRGAGVPENFMTFIKSLAGTPRAYEYYSCFISYSSKDDDFAKRLHADLQSENVRCWFAPEDLKIGEKFRPKIDEAIRLYDKLLLVLSENSVKSPWVEKEVETAFEKEHRNNRLMLFPIRLDDAVMNTDEAWAADIRRTRHIGDFRNWKDHDRYKAALDRLLRDLKANDKIKSHGSPARF